MTKKKEQKNTPSKFLEIYRFIARAFIMDLPIIPVLIVLVAMNRITVSAAFSLYAGIFIVTLLITRAAFHESEKFIKYLRSLAQGLEIEAPRFHKGIFGSFRLADAFQTVKNLWSAQTLSDASILDNLPDPLIMINEQSQIVFANRIAVSFFGDNLVNKPITDIFYDSIFNCAYEQVITEKTSRQLFEMIYEDSQFYAFQARIERLPALAKNGAAIVMVLHDITQFKLFKQQQDDFFANASHELKTPLSIISGFIETLQGPAKDDEAAREKFLALMDEQTKRMTRLVQDLLSFSKQQTKPQNQLSDVILLPELLKGIIEDLTLKAAHNDKELKLNLPHDIPRVKGNKGQLFRVFQNLIDNAIKYGDPNTAITVTAQLSNGFPQKSDKYLMDMRQVVLISVHNMGNPIPPHNINRLFERFYRIDSMRTRSVEGTGLGLGIAQQIVSDHEGLIDIKSSAEQGTTFSVYLPIDL